MTRFGVEVSLFLILPLPVSDLFPGSTSYPQKLQVYPITRPTPSEKNKDFDSEFLVKSLKFTRRDQLRSHAHSWMNLCDQRGPWSHWFKHIRCGWNSTAHGAENQGRCPTISKPHLHINNPNKSGPLQEERGKLLESKIAHVHHSSEVWAPLNVVWRPQGWQREWGLCPEGLPSFLSVNSKNSWILLNPEIRGEQSQSEPCWGGGDWWGRMN